MCHVPFQVNRSKVKVMQVIRIFAVGSGVSYITGLQFLVVHALHNLNCDTNHRWSQLWLSNYIAYSYVNVITYPCHRLNVGLVNPSW